MLPGAFKFFGREYASVHVGSNGYLTFGSGDFRYASIPEEKPLENLVPVYQDLNSSPAEETAPEEESLELGILMDYSVEEFEAEGRRLSEVQEESTDFNFEVQDNLASTDTHWDKHRISAWFQVRTFLSNKTPLSYRIWILHLDQVRFQYKKSKMKKAESFLTIKTSPVIALMVILTSRDLLDDPCFVGSSFLNTFQITLWLEGSSKAGSVQIWWGRLTNCKGAIVGLSPGYKPNEWKSSVLNTDVSFCGIDGLPRTPPAPPSGSPEEPFSGQGGGGSSFSLFS